MNTGLISVRYATALMEFAKETNSIDKVYEEAKLLLFMFSKMGELRLVLENPVISSSEKRNLILSAAGGKTSKIFEEFTDLLIKNRREAQIQNIMLKFMDLYREKNNIRQGKLITAYPVNEETEKHLIKLITDKVGGTLELEKVIDKEILGGFKLQVDDIRLDASLSGQLNSIKKEFIERNRRII